jgi:hypothetical protein
VTSHESAGEHSGDHADRDECEELFHPDTMRGAAIPICAKGDRVVGVGPLQRRRKAAVLRVLRVSA